MPSAAPSPHARTSGVTLLKNQPIRGLGDGGEDAAFVEDAVSIMINTDDDTLIDFLVNLGDSDAMIRVRDMTLQPTKDQRRLSGTLTLVASYQKSDDPAQEKGKTQQ